MAQLRYSPGDIIQENCQPFMKILLASQFRKRCHNCFIPIPPPSLKQCSSCQLKYYCNKACQREDWKFAHKVECKAEAFRSYERSCNLVDPNLKFQLLRLWAILKAHPEKGDQEYKVFDGTVRTYNSLLSHVEAFKKNQLLILECEKLADALLIDDPTITMEKLLEYYGKLVTNAFGILNENESEEIGTGIYVQPSALNHSCKPTAFYYIIGCKLVLRAIGPVEIGKDPCISYLSAHLPTSTRQQRLMLRYNFECQCERCSTEKDDDFDFALLNANLRKMKNPSLNAFEMDWKSLYQTHQEIIQTMETIYYKYDDRITNQFTRIAEYALGLYGQMVPVEQKNEICRETEHRLLVTYGKEHPDYKNFLMDLMIYGMQTQSLNDN